MFFGFTHCANICPATLGRLKSLHEARGGSLKATRVVFVSVDGDRDTPARLKSYLAPLSPDFVGLTGDPKATAKIAAQFAAVFFKEPAAKDGSYNVMHSTQVFAVDKAGRLRASFADASIEDMATDHGAPARQNRAEAAPRAVRPLRQSSSGRRAAWNCARNASNLPAAIASRMRAIRSR